MSMVKCVECGREVSSMAPTCPGCGAPVATPQPFRETDGLSGEALPGVSQANPATTPIGALTTKGKTSPFMWCAVVIMGFLLSVYLFNLGSPIPKPQQDEYPTWTNLDYRAASLGQTPKGELLTFKGEVIQRIGNNRARVATKGSAFIGYSGDDVYLVFDSQPQILVEDIIMVQGRYEGIFKYETVLRAERVVPKIRVDYFKVISARK